jgi:hypothetical protein
MHKHDFKEILTENGHHAVSINASATVLYQEYFQNKPLKGKLAKQFYDFLAQNRFPAWMIQVNGGNLIPFEDEVWVEKLDPKILELAGISFLAYVSPNNLFSKLEIEKETTAGSSKKINIQIFKDVEDAVAWFKSINML